MTDQDIIRDHRAQSLCKWGAARAGVVVLMPGLGTVALVANEIYMVLRIGRVYGVKLTTSSVKGFILSLGGLFAGKTLATLIPFGPLQIPIAIGVTYGVGKAAQAWIRDGMPVDVEKYKEVAKNAADYARQNIEDFKNDKRKDEPLGDEA
jgi:uncharacterized protein (DUF697 family)